MFAIEVTELGGPDVLTAVDRPRPTPAPGEVLIKAEAIGVNFIDTYFRSGMYPHPLPFIVGSEVCGAIVAVGDGVSGFAVGDRVACADAVGTYAEYSVAPAEFVAHVPDDVTCDVAASALLKGMTAHLLITSVYRVQRGDDVLLHAGAGGVGLILTQWATALGARVLTTASTPVKAELSRKAGAVAVLDYPSRADGGAAEFGAQIRAHTGGAGVAVVYDGVGRSTFDASLASLKTRGTLALFGAASGPVPPVDPQRLNAAGSVYLTRPSRNHFTGTANEFAYHSGELLTAVSDGTLDVSVGEHYSLANASQAHRDLEDRKTIGSVVLVP
jgi:NADPH:quinone reductase